MRQLDKFVRSPIHNQHEDVIKLFQYLRQHLSGHGRGLSKEKVFHQLFPNEPFNIQQLHYVSSYLLKVIEEYLAWQEWRNGEKDYQMALMRSLRQHKLDTLFDNCLAKAMANANDAQHAGTFDMYANYQLLLEQFNFERLKSGKQVFQLQEMTNALDAYFVAEKLKNACILFSSQIVNKSNYDTGLLSQVLAFLEQKNLKENPIIALYYHAFRTLESPKNDDSFQALKGLLNKHHNSLNLNELHDIYILTINYCIRQLNSGDQGFMQEVFSIYQLGLKSNAFVQNGSMSPRTYSNIVMAGLKLHSFNWVGNFIHEYKNYLPEKQREGFFNYNLARHFYEQKNYKLAMPLLLQMEYDDVLLTCLGKILLSKMHYELDEFESLSSLLQSFKVYVLRKRKLLGEYHQEGTLKFIHFLGKLLQVQLNIKEHLKHEISDTKVVVEKEWLLAQL